MEAGKGGGFDGFGVEGWGENADNCNRTTIKYFLKNGGTFTQWDTMHQREGRSSYTVQQHG